jgi:anti-sigma28 factor (negative regulator of flagellin synthesis)
MKKKEPSGSGSADSSHGAAPARAREREPLSPAIAAAREQALTATEARVAELRSQYLSGSYQVDAGKVAAKLIDDHLSQH